MKTKLFLMFFVILLVTTISAFALTQTGEHTGSFDVDVGEAEIVIGETPTVCQENWACSSWSDCINGVRTFICRDCNTCGTYDLRPANCGATQSCESEGNGGENVGGGGGRGDSSLGDRCTKNWQCGDWSACIDGRQTRTCQDIENCGTIELKPTTSRACVLGGTGEENNVAQLSSTTQETKKGIPIGITGAVIGFIGTPAGIAVFIFIVATIALAIFIGVMRKREKGK